MKNGYRKVCAKTTFLERTLDGIISQDESISLNRVQFDKTDDYIKLY